MDIIITALFIIFLFIFAIVLIGFFLMSRLVGGFGNLRALYRLFSGKKAQNGRRNSAKSSASGGSSRTYNNGNKSRSSRQRAASADNKMFSDSEGTYVDFEEVKD